ncbi:putative adenylyltransferase/sulfurtransferase MoeZ (Includes: Sulfur carrier protein CysO adenylyltransferase; Sulfur carrier protein CysO sulfurtransferase) [Candidatus Sulfopaludibacter sp. SbA4]|nr:putative adenylyltransferase/sulfurtransferase MoeZ (Includes: Sulfur carrier protein CysO adenylyltransferase; Sulfur carrier protein CysO sulfurtransferase) [Candidatus Sulfopaludibacter sp. SbA4]
MAKVIIPTPLRQFTAKQDSVTVPGTTVGEVLTALTAQYPDLRKQIFNDEGKVRSFVNVYLNDEDIRYLTKDATPAAEGDTISLVPSIAGGSALSVTAPPEEVTLSNDEILRYSRHLIIPEVGIEGQKKLKAAKVLLVGAGGLGAPLGLYLAAAGIGRIGIVDFDVVDFTNLQRQVIHSTADVGKKKLDSAAAKMQGINPHVAITKHETALTSENALEILKDYDIVVDGTDNFPTRYLVNDACVLLGKPNVYGSIFRFEGQATVFAYEGGPCYRCLYPEPPPPGLVPSCAEGGVLGILPGTIGLIQATETVKLILGIGEPLVGRLLLYDALGMRFRELKLRKNPECPVCGAHPTVTKLIDYQQFCGVPSAPPVQEAKMNEGEIDVTEVKQKMDRGDNFVLIDVREPHEYKICNIPGAKLIPLGEFPKHVGEFDPEADIVIHCRSGMRSAKACGVLRQAGFKRVRNMVGGILAWSDKVDPSVPKY